MDELKANPGPYAARPSKEELGSQLGDILIIDKSGFIIATVIHDETVNAEPNAHLLRASWEMYHALDKAAEYMNRLTETAKQYLSSEMTARAFTAECINLADGPHRQRVAAIMNDAMTAARGETKS
jgi:hypothetical protein